MSLFITIASPIIQSFFRPEIKSVLASHCPLLFYCLLGEIRYCSYGKQLYFYW
uniref:Uncharacterized protein n=1 Tax=Amphimedon queenslandica TaxID=400682 RepID=A0A1X7SXZ7_AMPQE